MRRFVIVPLVAGAALISSILATPAFGQVSGDVTATITAGSLCVTVPSATLQFPPKLLSTSEAVSISQLASPTIQSCSGLSQQIRVSASDATGGSYPWDLVTPADVADANCSSGSLVFKERFALNYARTGQPALFIGNGETALGTVAANAQLPAAELQLFMPCSSTRDPSTERTFTITFMALVP